MVRQTIKQFIIQAIESAQQAGQLPKLELPVIEVLRPQLPEHGDYATNVALRLAKELKATPLEIANQLKELLQQESLAVQQFSSIEVAPPGFINFRLSSDFLTQAVREILKAGENFGRSELGAGEKVQVEFISANPTGPLTLANARGGAVGDVLGNALKEVGYEVEKEYYINDAGNQVRILGLSVLAAADQIPTEENFYQGPHLKKWAKDNAKALTQHRDDPATLGRLVANDFMAKFIKPGVKKLGIEFDVWFSEYEKVHATNKLDEVLKFLEGQKLIYEQDEALWFKTTKFGDDKDRVVKTSDGFVTYFLADMAHHLDAYERGYRKINIVGADHHGYVGRMMAATEALGYPGQLQMIVMQLVRLEKDGQEVKMSKRAGSFVTVKELLKEVGVDVVRFFFLIPAVNTPMTFDLDLAKEQSDQNPVYYVQYAYTRIASILREIANQKFKSQPGEYLDESELHLIKELIRWPDILADITQTYEVHHLPAYIRELATAFHGFYTRNRVIDNDLLHEHRHDLILATQVVLKSAFNVMGISAPEKM